MRKIRLAGLVAVASALAACDARAQNEVPGGWSGRIGFQSLGPLGQPNGQGTPWNYQAPGYSVFDSFGGGYGAPAVSPIRVPAVPTAPRVPNMARRSAPPQTVDGLGSLMRTIERKTSVRRRR